MKKIMILTGITLAYISSMYSQVMEDYCKMSVSYGTINMRERTGTLHPESTQWYYVDLEEDVYEIIFSTCDSDFDTEIQIWIGCLDNERNMLYTTDNIGGCQLTVDFLRQGIYYVRIYRKPSTYSEGNSYNLLITHN